MMLHGMHDPKLVILSVIVAIIAAFTALSLAMRVQTTRGRARALWLAAAAVALGGGVWSMHFVAMLAFRMPGMPIHYDLTLTLTSLSLAIGFTLAGLGLLDWSGQKGSRTLAAGLLIGTGVVAMHYVGMAAMRMPAILRYDRTWVAISILIAVLAATAAVWLVKRRRSVGHRAVAAVVMGIAIAGMHYAGMHAAMFTAVPDHAVMVGAATGLGQTYLATGVGSVTLIVLLLALAGAQVERVLQRALRRESRLRFLGELNDRLFAATSATGAADAATTLLAAELEASRCIYFEVDADGAARPIREDRRTTVTAARVDEAGETVLGLWLRQDLASGAIAVINDVNGIVAAGERREALTTAGVAALICCSLIRDGRLVAALAVQQDVPRQWIDLEVELVQEVADRCWAHVERIGTETRLRESEERLRLAVDNAEIGFWDVDLISDELIWPPRTKAMFGIAADVPVTLQDFYDGLHPDDRATTSLAFDAAQDPVRRELYDVEYRTVGRDDGIIRWVAAKGRGIFDDRGNCVRVAGTVLEITERREAQDALRELNATLEARVDAAIREREEAQEALRHSQKMEAMGQLTGGVAHDFNNLLTPIVGSLDMLQRKGIGTEREQRLIAAAAQSAERARTLVQRLLAFARRQPLQPVPVDIAALVHGMGDLVASTTGPQIKVVVDAPDGLPHAKADPNQLEMAILNLAVNARDAMTDGGTLRISARARSVGAGEHTGLKAGDYLCLSVADSGLGMDAATLARAVEPFFSTKGIGKGTGLGLSMVHGLASQLDGALTIQSTIGVGTNIELWLPQSRIAADVVRPSELPASKSVSGTALLVDDETLVRMSTAEMLLELGYDVVEADSAEDAIGLLENGRHFDLLVTDHLMPGMTGTELIQKIRKADRAMPTLLVSGYAEAEKLDATVPRLTKPFRKDELAACLAQLLG